MEAERDLSAWVLPADAEDTEKFNVAFGDGYLEVVKGIQVPSVRWRVRPSPKSMSENRMG